MVLQERQRRRNMQESDDNLVAARNADCAEPRFEDRLPRDLSPIFEHTEDTSRSNSSPQLSERSGAGTELEVLSTFSEDSRVEPFGQGISGRIEHEQGKNAGSSNWLDTRIQEQARIVIDKDLSGRIQVGYTLSYRLSWAFLVMTSKTFFRKSSLGFRRDYHVCRPMSRVARNPRKRRTLLPRHHRQDSRL